MYATHSITQGERDGATTYHTKIELVLAFENLRVDRLKQNNNDNNEPGPDTKAMLGGRTAFTFETKKNAYHNFASLLALPFDKLVAIGVTEEV